MKRIDLIRRHEEMGCIRIRHGGRHDWYQNPVTTRPFSLYPDKERSRIAWRSIFSRYRRIRLNLRLHKDRSIPRGL